MNPVPGECRSVLEFGAPIVSCAIPSPALARVIRDDLARLADKGRTLRFWWRDDDATEPSRELDRLLALAARLGTPLAIAAVPGLATPALAARLKEARHTRVLVHGWRHANFEAARAKASEFGSHRDPREAQADLRSGMQHATELFGDRFLPVMVPPWNRIAPAMVEALVPAGYHGLSCFGAGAECREGFARIDTHIDPVAWRGDRDLVDPDILVRQWRRAIDDAVRPGDCDPIVGLLSHHRVTSERVWDFLDDFVGRLMENPATDVPPLAKLWPTGPNRPES